MFDKWLFALHTTKLHQPLHSFASDTFYMLTFYLIELFFINNGYRGNPKPNPDFKKKCKMVREIKQKGNS